MIKTYQRTDPPTRSQWGAVQDAEELAPGMWQVSTASHGGIKLSRERNADVPKFMRAEGGWYEEDCQWSIVALVFPEPFQQLRPWQKPGDKTHYQYAVETAQRLYPDLYRQFISGFEEEQQR
jgi:hypothetical protein